MNFKLSEKFLLTQLLSCVLAFCVSQYSFGQITTIKAGAICTVIDGDGGYGIIKILVMDKKMVHVKVYKNKYKKRPTRINVQSLSVGSMYDDDDFGFGHLPLNRKEFESWKPLQISFQKITKDEMEGYELWKENH